MAKDKDGKDAKDGKDGKPKKDATSQPAAPTTQPVGAQTPQPSSALNPDRSLSDKARELGRSVLWLDAPEAQDFPAAESYLSLIADQATVRRIVAALKKAPQLTYKAKDILRASRLDLLERTNVHVAHDLRKVRAGKPLSPILLVRGDLLSGRETQIADGYHRVCASYYIDENTDIPVRIVDAA